MIRTAILVRLLAYALLLFGSWNYNLLGIPDGMFWSRTEPRCGYLGSESNLVVCRLARAKEVSAAYPLAGATPEGNFVPYPSQVGLTGIGLAAIQNATGIRGATLCQTAAAGFALLTALVVAAILAAAQHWLGAPSGDIACVLAASTPIFLPFAPSLYWAPWLLLAPFALVWCFYPKAETSVRKAMLFAAVGVAAMAKALCGYEYITAVIAAPVAAAWFHQHSLQQPWTLRAKWAFGLVSVGLLGFAAAMALHVVQQERVLGQDGIAVIRNRAIARTASDPQAEAALAGGSGAMGPSRLAFAASCFWEYFDQRAVSVAGGFGRWQKDVPLKGICLAALAFAITAVLAHRRIPREAVALAGAVVLGFAASVSWQILAVNHMCVHRHLNMIVFTVPLLPLAYLAIGYALRTVIGPTLGQRLGPVPLGLIAIVMTVNGFTDGIQRDHESREQSAAEAAILQRLGEPVPAPHGGLGGAVDRVRLENAIPDSLLTEYGLLDLHTARPSDPTATVIEGWALGGFKTTARPTTRIAIVQGTAILPCQVLRFRRPDIERPIGTALPGSGFVAVIPSTSLNPAERLRVFIVSTTDGKQIVELAVKP
ncbi:MAG TPA: hypothetical protein VN641_09740 [Urbifossiella sp.]|nr:hypothetical protein [Urbifossiella sp.]